MRKIGNLNLWHLVAIDNALNLPNPNPRRVDIEFNTTSETTIHAIQDGEATLLGVVDGLEQFQFDTDGKTEIVFYVSDTDAEAEIWVRCQELAFSPLDDVEDEIPFVNILEREEISEDLQIILNKVNENMNRRLATAEREIERRAREIADAAIAAAASQPEQPVAPPPPDGEDQGGDDNGGGTPNAAA
ncbi:hypothetical protein [Tortoise microvirus 76]|nr:hypothetical protein [Tortoise microvirus 76]